MLPTARAWLAWWALFALTLTPAAAALADPSAAAGGADPPECQTVRFSDIGWTDVTATTALAAQLLRNIGYTPDHHGAVGTR